MYFRPDRQDLRVVGLYTGRVLLGIGVVMLIPAVYGFVIGEIDPALGFVIGASLTASVGGLAERHLATTKSIDRSHGVVIAGLSWLVAPLFGAVPLFLSGHFSSFLDAYFDAMSGFATAGLTVINDLDHLAESVNLWRHISQYLGGQGLVLVVLTLFAPAGGAVTMYVGEAREERILPNVVRTTRFIASVSLVWLGTATPVLAVLLAVEGFPLGDAVFHAVNLFMAAFSTGGFAPNTASIALYQSFPVELALMVVMLAGATSFGVHYQLVERRYREIPRHLEVRTFVACLVGFLALALLGLWQADAYASGGPLFRRGLFYAVSAQTTTGFATLPSRTLVSDWGVVAPAMVVSAMMIGAMSGSTGGGIKSIRAGLAVKGLRRELRRVLSPPSSAVVETYRAGKVRILRSDLLQPALMVLLGFLVLYAAGALVGMFYGYSFDQAFFESTSAAATIGLSVGLTGPDMPTGLKVVYILQMWMGRLELIAVFASFGFLWSMVRGRV